MVSLIFSIIVVAIMTYYIIWLLNNKEISEKTVKKQFIYTSAFTILCVITSFLYLIEFRLILASVWLFNSFIWSLSVKNHKRDYDTYLDKPRSYKDWYELFKEWLIKIKNKIIID